MLYSIAKFSKMTGLHKNTLRNWDASGKLKPIILKSGHRRYDNSHLSIIKNMNLPAKVLKNVIYARESTKDEIVDLQRQINKCKDFCIANGIVIDEVIQEIGNGLDFNSISLTSLVTMIENDEVSKIIVLYPDILLPIGIGLLETICKIHNVEIIIIDRSDREIL